MFNPFFETLLKKSWFRFLKAKLSGSTENIKRRSELYQSRDRLDQLEALSPVSSSFSLTFFPNSFAVIFLSFSSSPLFMLLLLSLTVTKWPWTILLTFLAAVYLDYLPVNLPFIYRFMVLANILAFFYYFYWYVGSKLNLYDEVSFGLYATLF